MKRYFKLVSKYKNSDIKLPQRQSKHSVGYDFESAEDYVIPSHTYVPVMIRTGVKAYFPTTEGLFLYNRSSNPSICLLLANGVGVVDSDYVDNPNNEGEIFFPFINISDGEVIIQKGDRIGQGVFKEFLKTDDDIEGQKRLGGFGSTNK